MYKLEFFKLEELIVEKDYYNLKDGSKLLGYFYRKEKEIIEKKKTLYKNYEKQISLKERKDIEYKIEEMLIIAFYKSKIASKITNTIYSYYQNVLNNIKMINLVDYTSINTEDELKVNTIINKDIASSLFQFELQLTIRYNTELPQFLIKKYKKAIEYKLIKVLRDSKVDISLYNITKEKKQIYLLFKELKLTKQLKTIMHNDNINITNENLLEIFILSNFESLKNDPYNFNCFVRNFAYIIDIINIPLPQKANKEYELNKLIHKYKTQLIDIDKETAKEKLNKLSNKILTGQFITIASSILIFTLICNKIIYKDKNEYTIQCNDSYRNDSRLRLFLFNFLKIFEDKYDSYEYANYITNVLLLNNISSLGLKNLYFPIPSIQKILTQSNNKTIKELTKQFFKEIIYKKSNKELTNLFIKETKEIDLKTISLYPSSPQCKTLSICILISGFLSENNVNQGEWDFLFPYFKSNNLFYYYNWPSESNKTIIGESLVKIGSIVSNFLKAKPIQDVSYSPFDVFRFTIKRAEYAGKLLAYILASKQLFPYQTITLIGFSLGTHVIKHCIKQLYLIERETDINCRCLIDDVYLMGGATSMLGKESKYKVMFDTIVVGKIYHCFSSEDYALKKLYTGTVRKDPIGLNMLNLNGLKKVNNYDLSILNMGHLDYREHLDIILSKINNEII